MFHKLFWGVFPLFMSIVLVGFILAPKVQASDLSDFNDKIKKMNEAGYVLLAEQAGETLVVSNTEKFKALIASDKPPIFYLLHKETGKKYRVKDTQEAKEEGWGEKIWEFFIWLVSPKK